MASVAICPHCYLQLVVPADVESDERVECPTCVTQFAIDEAVLRVIPEVVRQAKPPAFEVAAGAGNAIKRNDIKDVSPRDAGHHDTDEIEIIKARIEAQLAANGLSEATESVLPLNPPADQVTQPASDSAAQADVSAQADIIIEQLGYDLAAETQSDEIHFDDSTEHAETAVDLEPETLEPKLARPAVVTLADMLTPQDKAQGKSIDDKEVSGPSFDLPNVPLIPDHAATVEFDSSLQFGPAAETEFALEDVDFAKVPTDDWIKADSTSGEIPEAADENTLLAEPVFKEPQPAAAAPPFVVPSVPRVRKQRRVVRKLVGIAAGGIIGVSIGYMVLLYLRGAEGDFLRIARFLPDAVLPVSLKTEATAVARSASTVAPAAAGESLNVPAGYDEELATPDESLAHDESGDDDRYGADHSSTDHNNVEPSPLEEPAAEPIAEATPAAKTRPVDGPTYSIDQLATALEVGKEAQAGLVVGDLSDANVRRTKGMSYAKLCDLASAVVFIDPAAPSIESEAAINATYRLFLETLADAHTQKEVSRIAEVWVDSPHRRHGGIFLTGEVSDGRIAGDLYEYVLATESGSRFTLLMQEPLDPMLEGIGQQVGIIGSIVDRPAQSVAGYQGTAERVIWVTQLISLD